MNSGILSLFAAVTVIFGLSNALNLGQRIELSKSVCRDIELSDGDAILCQILFGGADQYQEQTENSKSFI